MLSLCIVTDEHSRLRLASLRCMVTVAEIAGGNFFKERFLNYYMERCEDKEKETQCLCVELLIRIARLLDETTREILCS